MKLRQIIDESSVKKHMVTMSFKLINYLEKNNSEIELIHETLRKYDMDNMISYKILKTEEIGVEDNEIIKKLKKSVNYCFSELYFMQKSTGEIEEIINFVQIQKKWKEEKMKLIMGDDKNEDQLIDSVFELDTIMKNDNLLNKKIPKTGSIPFQFPPIYEEEYSSTPTSVKLSLTNLYLMDELILDLNVVFDEDENKLVFEGKEDKAFKVVEYQILLSKILKIPEDVRMTLKIEADGYYELEEETNLIKNGVLNLEIDVEECINLKYTFELKEIYE
jgi:hypothetical protein